MKQKLVFLFLSISLFTYGQKTIYEHNNFKEFSKDHKILAIVPFLATLELDEEQELSKEQLDELEDQEGEAVQNALENYFLKRKEKKKFSVEFQDIKNTNAILAQNGISIDNIDIYTTQELCKILNVDGLISGNLTLSALISKSVPKVDFLSIIMGKSDFGRIAIKISDGKTGKLLWKYEKVINRKSGKNTNAIIEGMMKNAARKFPYDREKEKKRRKD
ncbi:hypothetical protein GWK08_12060 [Leptobacterium flavescens]|uniref:Uncharacterized protein n=1 Tax=Leptobacterium flavescens TaxID=472055 RepID=A0A6P0UQS7_9FLAO|nr:hypothetical protein [Leptobacterium flavescens]NER14179.1 hypothetical protein [Leptobacterium flavescens]